MGQVGNLTAEALLTSRASASQGLAYIYKTMPTVWLPTQMNILSFHTCHDMIEHIQPRGKERARRDIWYPASCLLVPRSPFLVSAIASKVVVGHYFYSESLVLK